MYVSIRNRKQENNLYQIWQDVSNKESFPACTHMYVHVMALLRKSCMVSLQRMSAHTKKCLLESG